ncbi:MarR family transcriptional regulator [Halobacillus salinarum]|uniref:HTH-type transcriptional regulator SarZ n=1 Tax=Halobacillus salinarum TaxID=2932257 RepID=A0ABY4EHU6_9BACI|nr:MarR family transcriptional regulator [Halobacillus salinarum]UOQ43714.1 MarR family transcriptional regulator [Halobacillus salinarum]
MNRLKDFLTLDKQLCFAIYETGSQFHKLYTKALQSFGLTYPQYLVLLALWEKDHMTFKELGEKLSLGSGTLTPMIKRMESKGWIAKERSKSDERSVCVALESKAIDQKEAITEKVRLEIESCQIKQEEYEQLLEQLHSLTNKLKTRESV